MKIMDEYEQRINKVIQYIEQNINEELSVSQLAKIAAFSISHFQRLFKRIIGETLLDYIKRKRMEKAIHILLSNPDMAIINIALDCGFSSSATFARIFKSFYGISASELRKNFNISHYKFRQPFIKNFSPGEYKASPGIWGIVQANNGAIFFGTTGFGILMYQNNQWSTIKIPHAHIIYSLAKDEKGVIYVGTIGDFGYLEEKNKTYYYHSLLDKEWVSQNPVDIVWNIITNEQGVYFQTRKIIYRWHNETLTSVKGASFFYKMNKVKEKIYLRYQNKGFVQIQGSHIKIVENGNLFAKKSLLTCLGFDENHMLCLAGETILDEKKLLEAYLYDGKIFSSFNIDAINYLKENLCYSSLKLPQNLYAIGTKGGGVVIIDNEGSTKFILNKKSGLMDDYIRSIYIDNKKRIWLGTSYGISRIDIFSPLFIYDEKSGFKGQVDLITRFNGKLYFTTNYGLYFESPFTTAGKTLFKKIEINARQFFCMHKTDDSLLCGVSYGFGEIKNDKLIVESIKENVYSLLQSKLDSNIIYAGTNNGLILLKRIKGKWKKYKNMKFSLDWRISSICETDPGILWIYKEPNEIIMLNFKKGFHKEPEVNLFPHINEKDFYRSTFYYISHKLFLATIKGIFSFCKQNKTFVLDHTFGEFFNHKPVSKIILDYFQNAWIIAGYENKIYKAVKKKNGTYQLNEEPFIGLDDLCPEDIFPERDGTIWFGGKSKIICYDTKYE